MFGETSVAIVDIGSNSVRLVVYDALDRAPVPMFNEKALCALGAGVVTTGKLAKRGIEEALVALRRFHTLRDIMGVGRLYVIATAAARGAKNGPEFLDAATHALGGVRATLLSGQREAELSALGVVSGIHRPNGVVGDLGGGSLELVDVRDEEAGPGVSLPFGGLALMDASGRSVRAASKLVRESFAGCDVLDGLRGRTFYAVGGTWRALAKLHMRQVRYPVSVMHGYTITAREAAEFADLAMRAEPGTLPAINSVSAARRPLLAYGAVVLDELIRRARPKDITISTSGVREGLLFEALRAEERRLDPLLVACAKLNALLSRAPAFAEELADWAGALLASFDILETEEERRMRVAACLLSEVNWRAHPDYRGAFATNIVAGAQLPGVDHAGRQFLTLVTSLRHLGPDAATTGEVGLVPYAALERGRVLGAAMRVASLLAAGMPGVLPRAPLVAAKGKLALTLPTDLAALIDSRLQSRVKQLAKTLGRDPVVAAD